jgi:Ca2+-binding RTX toxin-like protein
MRIAVVLVSMVVMLLLGSVLPVPPILAAPGCTFAGSNGRDVYAGDRNGEVICLLDGDEYAHGNGGRDRILGGPGPDSLVGGAGRDKLKGGPGEDRLFATDQRGNDVVRGGAGADRCFADPGDVVRGCESVHRGNVSATTEALSANSFDVTAIAEDALEEVTPTPLPGGGGTNPTQPPGAVFPPCTPPPPPGTSPAPC